MNLIKMGKWMVTAGLLQGAVFAQTHTIPIKITGMTPHLGQLFKARMVETSTGIQKAETTITAIGSENFQLLFLGESGIAYDLDLFVDTDGNKSYSAPPLDHAWRQPIPVVHHGESSVTFIHDANYTDIKYPNAGVAIRLLRNSSGKSNSREARLLVTPLSYAQQPDISGFTLLGAQASTGSRRVLVLPRGLDKGR